MQIIVLYYSYHQHVLVLQLNFKRPHVPSSEAWFISNAGNVIVIKEQNNRHAMLYYNLLVNFYPSHSSRC